MLRRWLLYIGSVALGLAAVGALLGAFVLALLYPTLPSLDTLTDYRPKIPLRVVSADGRPPADDFLSLLASHLRQIGRWNDQN